jgi:iron(II)-dependent oxidoreductase
MSDAAKIEERLARSRARLLALVERVGEDVLASQHSPIMGPILWDLGHIAAFEKLWLVDAVDGWRPDAGGGMPPLFDAAVHARSIRGELELPCRDDCQEELKRVRQAALERLHTALGADDPLVSHGFVWNMVAQHESWHIETILAALNLREDVDVSRTDGPASRPWRPERIAMAGGPATIGTDDRSRAYDNERPAHQRVLAPYAIASHPVTVGEYAAFVDDGGYRTRSLWTDEGWAWLADAQVTAPHGWSDGQVTRFGRRVERRDDEPVQHVCFHEAQAYARWAGARLPTEFEWEHAARCHPDGTPGEPDLGGAFAESTTLGPAPVGAVGGAGVSGAQGMFGNTWEWTASMFDGYPGFRGFPYREYSADFFDGTMPVLRGGSWASARHLLRPTLRSWDLKKRRETIFVGFRLAWGSATAGASDRSNRG